MRLDSIMTNTTGLGKNPKTKTGKNKEKRRNNPTPKQGRIGSI
jgi:hypothetical protein